MNKELAMAYVNRGAVYLLNLGDRRRGCSDFKKACEVKRCDEYNLMKKRGYCD